MMGRGPRGSGLLEASGQEARGAAKLLAHAPARTDQEAEQMKASAKAIAGLPQLRGVSVHDATIAVLDLAAAEGVRPQVRARAFHAITELLAAIAKPETPVGDGDGESPDMELGSQRPQKGQDDIEL